MGGALLRPRLQAVATPAWLRSPELMVVAITLIAALLRLDGIAATRTDPYYDAAVRSMGQSWHNFFFAAYEPGASVAIDKPPIDLWLQVFSTKLFGFGSVGLLLPQAIAGTLAVPVLYDLVRRVAGVFAGIAAALVLAVLPASVLTARSDTMDSLMMLLTVLAAWLVVLSIQHGRARWLYLAAVVAGLAFEVKLLEALIALPAVAVLYLVGSSEPIRRRAIHAGIALAIFLVAALWWPVAVSLAPGHKPFAIGSTDGSVWSATFVFNGTSRISPPAPTHHAVQRHPHRAVQHRAVRHSAVRHPRRRIRSQPGATRLLSQGGPHFGQLVGIDLVAAAALAVLAAALALMRRSRRRSTDPTARLRHAFAWALGVWLLPAVIVFSAVHQLHPRYLEAITPALAATIGISLASIVHFARRDRLGALALAIALAAPVAYVLWSTAQGAGSTVATLLLAATAVLALAAGAGARTRSGRAAVVIGAAAALGALTVAPAARSAELARQNATDSGHVGDMKPRELHALSSYLAPRTRGARYEVLSATYQKVGALIVHDGRPVLIATSVSRRPLITVAQLRGYVASGQVRYALFASECGTGSARQIAGCPAVLRWARANSTDVSQAAGLHAPGVLFRFR